MSGTLSEVAWRIASQKLRYGQKTLTEDSLWSNLDIFYGLIDFLSFSFDFMITDTLFSSLLSSILFGIPLTDVIPATLDFSIELPTPEEFARGTLLEVEAVNLTDVFPELLTLSTIYYGIFGPEESKALLTEQVEKGVFGRSKYGYAYYDPPAVREFLRSTLYALTKKRSTDETVRARVEAAAKALDLNPELVRYVFNSMQMLTYAKHTACTFDYCWFDVSNLPREGSSATVVFVGWELTPAEAEYLGVFDPAGTCWLDNCVLDYSVFAPDEVPTVYVEERAGNLLTEVSYYVFRRVRSRLLATPYLLANYQTVEEMAEPRRSIRTEQYGLGRFVSEGVRQLVSGVVGGSVGSEYVVNLYVDAVLDLLRRLSRPGGWGDEAFRAMSRDELLQYFIGKWGAQGLDPDLLTKLFKTVYDVGLTRVYSLIRSQVREVVRRSRGGT